MSETARMLPVVVASVLFTPWIAKPRVKSDPAAQQGVTNCFRPSTVGAAAPNRLSSGITFRVVPRNDRGPPPLAAPKLLVPM